MPGVMQRSSGPDMGLPMPLQPSFHDGIAVLLARSGPWGEDMGGEVCAWTLFLFPVQGQTPAAVLSSVRH